MRAVVGRVEDAAIRNDEQVVAGLCRCERKTVLIGMLFATSLHIVIAIGVCDILPRCAKIGRAKYVDATKINIRITQGRHRSRDHIKIISALGLGNIGTVFPLYATHWDLDRGIEDLTPGKTLIRG